MNDRLWTVTDLCEYFVVSETQAASIAAQDGFPKPIVLPSRGKGERQQKRWLPQAVRDWAESLAKAA